LGDLLDGPAMIAVALKRPVGNFLGWIGGEPVLPNRVLERFPESLEPGIDRGGGSQR
jgi:hypothetical protein